MPIIHPTVLRPPFSFYPCIPISICFFRLRMWRRKLNGHRQMNVSHTQSTADAIPVPSRLGRKKSSFNTSLKFYSTFRVSMSFRRSASRIQFPRRYLDVIFYTQFASEIVNPADWEKRLIFNDAYFSEVYLYFHVRD